MKCVHTENVVMCLLLFYLCAQIKKKVKDGEEVAGNKTLSLAESVNGSARFVELSATTQ